MKNVFLKISQNSQKNTSGRVSFLLKLQVSASGSQSFCKVFKNTFLIERLWWLLLVRVLQCVKVVYFE